MSRWDPYRPSAQTPWDLRRVVHLHRRVVFGGCAEELRRDLADDPQDAVSRVLGGEVRAAGVPAEFDELSEIIGAAAADSGHIDRLGAWWLYRCLYSPDPLRERLTLMWHNHFATSRVKVRNAPLMRAQNETLRRNARGPFSRLFREMAHDPALLIWLDAPSNRVGQANENLAREMMELFALGIGNYSETDVQEAARALTGWTVRRETFRFFPELHDAGEKTILGETGNWTGDDFVQIVLKQPAVSRRLAWRLVSEFFGEDVVDEGALTELAEGLSNNNLDIGWAVETILRSALFFSDENVNRRVADPVSYVLTPLRAIECWNNPPSLLALTAWVERAGQKLFSPPNVGGWKGGRTWLSTRTVLARAKFAEALAKKQFLETRDRPTLQQMTTAVQESMFATTNSTISSNGSVDPEAPGRRDFIQLLSRPEAHLH